MSEHVTSSQGPAGGHSTILAEEECRELLTTTTVGQVAFVNAGGLQLIPLNFAVIESEIYFRTATDSVLAELADGPREVAFGIGYRAENYRHAWNVTVKGTTTRVSDPAKYQQVMSWSRLRPWAGGKRGVVIQLAPRSIEGRRVRID